MRAAFALAWCVTLVLAVTADAEVPSDAQDRLGAAIARFEALARKTQADGRLPQLSRPDERPVLEAVWDATILGRPPYVEKDLAALEAMEDTTRRITTSYLGGEPPSDEDRQFMRISPEVLAHAKKYPDEIVRASTFVFQIAVDRLSAFADRWMHLDPDARKAAAAEIQPLRDELNQKLFVLPRLLAGPIMSEASKRVWADALADNAVALADATPPFAREALLYELKDTLPKIPEPLKPKLEALVSAMTTRACAGLCLVPILPDPLGKP